MPRIRPAAALICILALTGACTPITVQPGSRPTAGGPETLPEPPPFEPVPVVVWSSRKLPPELRTTVGRVPGVLAVGVRRSGVVDLRAVRGARLDALHHGQVVCALSIVALPPRALAMA